MSPAARARRWFRPQISLRALLLLMLLAGVGLTCYRWPWVETTQRPLSDPFGPESTTTTEDRVTFRRNWRGKKMKHGLAQKFVNGKLWREQHFYDGELQGERDFDNEGRVTREKHFRDGQVHGAFRVGDGKAWALQGQYVRGERHGVWQFLVAAGIDPEGTKYLYQLDPLHRFDRSAVVPQQGQLVHGQWDRGRLHGKWTWEAHGNITHTEEFDHDELVRWDGKPVVAEFWQWVGQQNDPHLLAGLTAANTTGWQFHEQSYGSYLHRVCFEVENARVFAYPHKLFIRRQPEHRGRLVPAMCEFALRNDLAFAYRYGGLWLVRTADRDKPFVDPTGVDKVAFHEFDMAVQIWNEAVEVLPCEGFARQCIANLLDNTSIEYEIRNVDQPATKFRSENSSEPLFKRRRRRDALGLILYLTGCRCELRGNVLVIKPQEGRAVDDKVARPLLPLQGRPPRTTYDPFKPG